MSLQQQDRPLDRRVSPAACAASHYCNACDGLMIIVMATPGMRSSGARFYQCEYLCDCGYREVFEEEI